MILSSHGIIGSQIGQIDADAQAFFDRVATAGGSLSTTEKAAVNQLVLDMKSDGIWTKMKAIYPMVGASAAACAQNLKSSSFTGTFTSGWTFASTGVTPNGSSAYMNTGLTPSITLTTADFHLSYYSRTNNNSSIDFDMGVGTSAGTYSSSMFLRRSNNQSGFDSGNASSGNRITATLQTDSTGLYVGTIRSLTDRILKRNNIDIASNTSSLTNVLMDSVLLIGAYNERPYNLINISPNYYGSKECAFSSLGDGLTDTEASYFYNSVQAFQTTLSRQV